MLTSELIRGKLANYWLVNLRSCALISKSTRLRDWLKRIIVLLLTCCRRWERAVTPLSVFNEKREVRPDLLHCLYFLLLFFCGPQVTRICIFGYLSAVCDWPSPSRCHPYHDNRCHGWRALKRPPPPVVTVRRIAECRGCWGDIIAK